MPIIAATPVAHEGSLTNQGDRVTIPMGQELKTMTKGILIAISGLKVLSNILPGLDNKSATQNGNVVEQSYPRVFIEGNCMAHISSRISAPPFHVINRGDDTLQPIEVVTYVSFVI